VVLTQRIECKNAQKEAEIVEEAGKPGVVTIATNMAGRGTDIKLSPEVKAAGGLAIVVQNVMIHVVLTVSYVVVLVVKVMWEVRSFMFL
jgi:hypothetical protein